MIKRFFSVLLLVCTINFFFLPVLAKDEDYNTNRVIDAEFKTDFNTNKASQGQIVQFVSTEEYKTGDFTIPKGTIFDGEVKHFKKGRWGYRRAKAVIKINKMILPDGKTYNIKASTKRHVLKGSAAANVGKGIISFPFAIVTGVAGAVIIIVEAISIVGLVAVGPTSYVVGRTMGKLTHGVNYKKHQGDAIQLKIKSVSGSAT